MTAERKVLALAVLLLIVGGIGLAFVGKTLPDALIALGGTCVGLLRGSGPVDGPQEVTVKQPAGQPVPTAPAEPEPTPPKRRRA